jgi:hypothetical protein
MPGNRLGCDYGGAVKVASEATISAFHVAAACSLAPVLQADLAPGAIRCHPLGPANSLSSGKAPSRPEGIMSTHVLSRPVTSL